MYTLHFDIKRLITRASLRAYSQTHAVSLKQHALHALHTRMRARTHELRLTRAYTQIPRTYARTLTLTRKCTHTGKRKLSVQLHVRWLQHYEMKTMPVEHRIGDGYAPTSMRQGLCPDEMPHV